jgi:hypothetical protein
MQKQKRLESKAWRMSHLYKIINKDGDLVVFERNAVQQWYADNAWSRNLILKARQLGMTTDACIDMLDDVIFTPNYTAVIIAHEKEAVIQIFKKVRLAWEEFDDRLKNILGLQASTDTKNELSFNNNSSIRVALSSRAATVNRLHVSEFAKLSKKFPDKAREVITGSFPSVPKNGRIDIESTSEGPIGDFYLMYKDAEGRTPQSELDFKAFFFPWFKDPAYAMPVGEPVPTDIMSYGAKHLLTPEQTFWYFKTKQTLKDEMKREYPTTPDEAFEAGSDMMFSSDALDRLTVRTGTKIGAWTKYEDYKPGHNYGVGVDVAEGIGRDHSTIVVWDFSKLRPQVVATYKENKISPQNLAYEAKNAGYAYGMAVIAVERNNHGYATVSKLAEIYPEDLIFRMEDEARPEDKLKGVDTIRFGWHTNLATKPKMLYDLSNAVADDLADICDYTLIADMRSYPKEDVGRTRPLDGQTSHWDMLMAAAIGFQMKNHIKSYREVNQKVTVIAPKTNFNPNSAI